jgi:hypothetical protein
MKEKYKEIKAIRDAAKKNKENTDFYDYLLSPHELWARAYSQYITAETKDVNLLPIHEFLSQTRTKTQWTSLSFQPIQSEIRKILQDKGLLVTPNP